MIDQFVLIIKMDIIMKRQDDDRLEKMREIIIGSRLECKLNAFMGIEWVELEKGYGKTRLKLKEEVFNPYGFMHGGALLTIADVTAGSTACMNGYFVTTVNSSMNFLAEGKNTEYIYCEARELRHGRHLAVYDVRITDDAGNLLDSAEFSYFISDKEVLPEE